jgi:hypothetical protein
MGSGANIVPPDMFNPEALTYPGLQFAFGNSKDFRGSPSILRRTSGSTNSDWLHSNPSTLFCKLKSDRVMSGFHGSPSTEWSLVKAPRFLSSSYSQSSRSTAVLGLLAVGIRLGSQKKWKCPFKVEFP